MAKHYYVYILTNPTYTTLYVGMTNDIERRVYEHSHKLYAGFASRYNLTYLVFCEETANVYDAIQREKQIKGWTRARKIDLIESVNPEWRDLSHAWFAPPRPQILRTSG
jgi:putative endonuclease